MEMAVQLGVLVHSDLQSLMVILVSFDCTRFPPVQVIPENLIHELPPLQVVENMLARIMICPICIVTGSFRWSFHTQPEIPRRSNTDQVDLSVELELPVRGRMRHMHSPDLYQIIKFFCLPFFNIYCI